jgi:hypothetical protein
MERFEQLSPLTPAAVAARVTWLGLIQERTRKFVILANHFPAVFALQAANHEMPFSQTLKVLAEKYVERETTGRAGDRDELRGNFLADLKTESGSDPAHE